VILRLLRAVLDFANTPNVGTGLALLEVVFEETADLIPVDSLRASVDDAARKRAEKFADTLEDLKVGPR
jgi:hypothetical protein